jgi:hypothetical protein
MDQLLGGHQGLVMAHLPNVLLVVVIGEFQQHIRTWVRACTRTYVKDLVRWAYTRYAFGKNMATYV